MIYIIVLLSPVILMFIACVFIFMGEFLKAILLIAIAMVVSQVLIKFMGMSDKAKK